MVMAGDPLRVLYPLPDGEIGNEMRLRAETGRSSLRYFFGETDQRRRAFHGCVNDDRVLGIASGEQLVGYASFTFGGKGPLLPTLTSFTTEYGFFRGLFNLAVFKLTEPWVGASSLYIYNIQVEEDQRGLGVGSALLDAIETIARQSGCRSVTLQVTSHNKAIILYVKKGFMVSGTVKLGPLRSFFPFKCLVNMERLLPDTQPVLAAQPSQRPLAIGGSRDVSAT